MQLPFWDWYWHTGHGANTNKLIKMEDLSILWGIAVPATIFVIAFAVTWFLYRHFKAKE